MHGHQQGGGAQAPAPEAGLDHGRGLREVHAGAGVRPAGRVRALGQADALPLPELPVRRPRPVPDDRAQVPAHGVTTGRVGPGGRSSDLSSYTPDDRHCRSVREWGGGGNWGRSLPLAIL